MFLKLVANVERRRRLTRWATGRATHRKQILKQSRDMHIRVITIHNSRGRTKKNYFVCVSVIDIKQILHTFLFMLIHENYTIFPLLSSSAMLKI